MNANAHSDSGTCFDFEQVEFNPRSASNLSTAFYDLILGQDEPGALVGSNDIEEQVIGQLQSILASTEALPDLIPALPKPVHELIASIEKDNTDFSHIARIVSQDVKLTVEVIRVANSPLFRASEHRIESIQQAITTVGISNVVAIVTEATIRGLLNVKPLYFKWFGELIWVHARQCAAACQYLAKPGSAFDAYLAGLVYDTGKIIIFKCFAKIISETTSNDLPQSAWFKSSMTRDSKWLSVLIATEWQLPESVIVALQEQEATPESELGKVLYISNIFSEINLLIKDQKLEQKEGEELLKEYGLPETTIQNVFTVMQQAVDKS